MSNYTGVKVLETTTENVNELYKNKEIAIWDNRLTYYPNMYLVVKDGQQASALARVKDNKIVLLNKTIKAGKISPKNKEQVFALDALMDDTIKVVAITGRAGSGKTILALSAAIQKFEERKYKKNILTRPMSAVGGKSRELGLLPGDISEKFGPHLQNYICNMDYILGQDKDTRATSNKEDMMDWYNVEFLPIQLFRGASFMNSFIIVDEAQILTYQEMLTIGTRVAEGSKLVILGDLKQRDEKIAIPKTGIYKFFNSELAKESKFVACIELLKCERGEVSELFSNIFEEDE